jgi:hypothetical protein
MSNTFNVICYFFASTTTLCLLNFIESINFPSIIAQIEQNQPRSPLPCCCFSTSPGACTSVHKIAIVLPVRTLSVFHYGHKLLIGPGSVLSLSLLLASLNIKYNSVLSAVSDRYRDFSSTKT